STSRPRSSDGQTGGTARQLAKRPAGAVRVRRVGLPGMQEYRCGRRGGLEDSAEQCGRERGPAKRRRGRKKQIVQAPVTPLGGGWGGERERRTIRPSRAAKSGRARGPARRPAVQATGRMPNAPGRAPCPSPALTPPCWPATPAAVMLDVMSDVTRILSAI